MFGEGGAAERTVAEQERQHTATAVKPGARTNGTAVASLILALIGLGIGSVLAVVLGYEAQREIDRSAGSKREEVSRQRE